MGVDYDVDVTIQCETCYGVVHADDIICKDCAEKNTADALAESSEILKEILEYINEATILKPVEIPGEAAFLLREKIRKILTE